MTKYGMPTLCTAHVNTRGVERIKGEGRTLLLQALLKGGRNVAHAVEDGDLAQMVLARGAEELDFPGENGESEHLYEQRPSRC
jgi:hypothetical protein